ncbi:MAG: 5'-3' exonuclease [Solirubrobacteraceae bacterium]
MAPLLIADVPWLLYRSFFALPKSIKGADGEPVNALLGTVNALLAASEACSPRAVVACFGAEQARYRVELYPPYHAHRDPMPAELAHQWKQAPALLESFGWVVADAHELEADDAMLSYARSEREAGGEAFLLTGDRDLLQALDKHVSVLDLGKGGKVARIGPQQVVERHGVAPGQIPDLIALRGDPSDGLPGAPGIGAKTAAALLREHGSLERVLAVAEHAGGAGSGMTPRVAASVREHAKLLRAFKQIATLQPIDVERPADRSTDFASAAAAARELGMNRLAERLSSGAR